MADPREEVEAVTNPRARSAEMSEQGKQSMADHEHGTRFVDDEGRCLACAVMVRDRRLAELVTEHYGALAQEREKGKALQSALRPFVEAAWRWASDHDDAWEDGYVAPIKAYRDDVIRASRLLAPASGRAA